MSTRNGTAVAEMVTMGIEVLADVGDGVDATAGTTAAVLDLVRAHGLRAVLEVIRDAGHAARDAHEGDGTTEASMVRDLAKFADAMGFAVEGVQ